MLEMRPNCECCDCDLPIDAANAMMCTFECTFCRECAQSTLKHICPNCGGNLVERPARPEKYWNTHQASTTRVVKQGGCV
ncbi:MAG: DUF1272 domain-containing protein [Pseudomonadota bacterium]